MSIQKKFVYDLADKELIDCNCCGSKNLITVLKNDRYSMNLTTVICQHCGLVFTNPVLSDTQLSLFYNLYYRNYYVSIDYPTSEYIKQRKLKERAGILLNHIKMWLPPSLRLLDIGASEGTVLNTIQSYCNGNKIETAILKGVEPNGKFAEYAKKEHQLDIFNGMMSEFITTNTLHFNFVILNHVLEHFKDPSDILKNVWNLLEPDGYLFIEVPNLEYNMLDISFFHVAHIFHFTPYSLEQIALKMGFIPVYKKLSSSSIHPWAMAYIFQKKDITNPFVEASPAYINFLQKHISKVHSRTWHKRIHYSFTLFQKILQKFFYHK